MNARLAREEEVEENGGGGGASESPCSILATQLRGCLRSRRSRCCIGRQGRSQRGCEDSTSSSVSGCAQCLVVGSFSNCLNDEGNPVDVMMPNEAENKILEIQF